MNIQKPVFSIIVPVYKVEQYLERCVVSLINQTEKNIEIMLVDDGSPDNCPCLCDIYAEKDIRIQVIHKTNGGLSDARNAGIEKATGEYIMFVDSDDYIELDACEKLVPYVENKSDIIAMDGIAEGGTVNLEHTGIENGRLYNGQEFLKSSVLYGRIPMAAWLYVYRRDFLNEHKLRFKKGILHEDEEFTPRAILKADNIINTGIVNYHYIVRENSIMTQKDKRKNADDLFDTCQSLCLLYDELEDIELKLHLKDLLVSKYLSLFQEGQLYKYGSNYLHKDFVNENAYKKRTRKKAFLYTVSPILYWHLNRIF